MIVAYQPGGSIRDARVVLKHDETLPNKYNVRETIVYREREDNPREWIMVKPKFVILAEDSPLLTQPQVPEADILSLTNEETSGSLYEHVDIIRFEEPNDEDSNKEKGRD